jgi:hypothetical protein
MSRVIGYGRRKPADVHYEALRAEHSGTPAASVRAQMRARARTLASEVSPDAVHPYYIARLAATENALHSPDRDQLWLAAADDAATGGPLPPGAEAIANTLEKPTGAQEADGALEKIAKYVPAEMITLTTLAFAALTPSGDDVWWLVAGGALANMLYLFGTALQARKETKEMPRWYFYPLSGAALFLWALAVIPVVGSGFGIEEGNAEAQKTFALAFAAFLVPLLDIIATGIAGWWEEKSH